MKLLAASTLALLLSAAMGTAAAAPHHDRDDQDNRAAYSDGYRNDTGSLLVRALLGYGVSANDPYRQRGAYGNTGYYGNPYGAYANQPYAGAYRGRDRHFDSGYYRHADYPRSDDRPFREEDADGRRSRYQDDRGYRGEESRRYDEESRRYGDDRNNGDDGD